jgi:hypothetical protein
MFCLLLSKQETLAAKLCPVLLEKHYRKAAEEGLSQILVNQLYPRCQICLQIDSKKLHVDQAIMFVDLNDELFVSSIDDIIINSKNDAKTKNALSNLDREAKLRGMTLHQMIHELMQKDINEERAIKWLKTA